MYLMFSNNFILRQNPRKSYRGTFLWWYKSKRYQGQDSGGSVIVLDDLGPVIGKVCSVFRGLISLAYRSAKPLLIDLGVKDSDISPFCRYFQTAMELRDVFIKYLPFTFKYSDVNSAGDKVLAEEEVDDAPALTESNVITGERVWQISAAIAARFSMKSNESDASGGISTNGGSSSAGHSSTKPEPAVTPGDPEEKPENILAVVKLVLTSAGGATLLPSAKAAFSVLGPMEKVSGSMSNDRKLKSLKYGWISKPNFNRKNDRDGGNGDGEFVKRGMVVTMNIALARGSNTPVTFRQYRVLGVYKNITIIGC